MLKKRLIPCLVMRDQIIVQSIGFQDYLPIGSPRIAIEFVSNWDVDEILLLDITAGREHKKPNLSLINELSNYCFVPLTVGGGIRELDDIKNLLQAGADKIAINTIALEQPGFIGQSAQRFGSQCIVVSMDVRINSDGKYEVVGNGGQNFTGRSPLVWAKQVQDLGAGEIFLNSVDRDGMGQGYDLELIKMVVESVSIPVIACGGVGQMAHLAAGITQAGASAVSAGNIFHFTEHSTIVAKDYLQNAGIDVRLNTAAKYDQFHFDHLGRICKKQDTELENIWFERQQREKI